MVLIPAAREELKIRPVHCKTHLRGSFLIVVKSEIIICNNADDLVISHKIGPVPTQGEPFC